MPQIKVRKNPKNVVQIDTNIKQFVGELADMSGYIATLASSVHFLANDKDGGQFTRAMAKSYKVEIIRGINTQGKSLGIEWEPFDDTYRKWREKWWGFAEHWHFTGTTRKSIIVTKHGKEWIARLDKRVRIPQYKYKKGGGVERGKSRPAELVATGMEFGTSKMRGRPLFSPAVTIVMSERFPAAVKTVEQSLKAAVQRFSPKIDTARKYESSNVVSMTDSTDVAVIEEIDKVIIELFKEGGFQAIGQYSLSPRQMAALEKYQEDTIKQLERNVVVGSADEIAEARKWLEENDL